MRVQQLDIEPQPQPTIETSRASEQTTTNFFISILSEGENDCGKPTRLEFPYTRNAKLSIGFTAIL